MRNTSLHLQQGWWFVFALAAAAALCGRACWGDPIRTEVVQHDGQWQLLRNGQPYLIKGAGGDASMQLLKDLGGNSVRTWGADESLGKTLDEAQALGLSVTVGIWLGQERSHFSYNNADDVAKQYNRVRETILKYKDHPAVLMWGLGNEMEGYGKGDNAAIWSAVENVAALAKKLDPNYPTMTVIAEIGGERVKDIHQLCPDIDVVGINSYGGCSSIPQRYKAAGGTKPYVVTEFGPLGTWEAGKTSYGALIEPTSTQKAAFYKQSYDGAVTSQPGLCLGSYVFLWGWKQEGTATWFGMMLPDGTRLDPVQAMSEEWTGHPVAVPGPQIQPIEVHGLSSVAPGSTVRASVVASDPADHPITVEWQLQRDAEVHGVGGDFEPATVAIPQAIVHASNSDVELHMPQQPGVYRLYAIARDDQHQGATANVPILVKARGGDAAQPAAENGSSASDAANGSSGEKSAAAAAGAVALPLVIFGDNGNQSGYIPAGWMGNTAAIALDEKCTTHPHTGSACIKAQYKAADGFGGVVWQNPANNWGDLPGGKNLSGAKKLTFWARGENGGENVQFKFGILGSDKKYYDTASGETTVSLTSDWKQYSIDLEGKDLSRIVTGFCWVAAGQGGQTTFYLDDIQYE